VFPELELRVSASEALPHVNSSKEAAVSTPAFLMVLVIIG